MEIKMNEELILIRDNDDYNYIYGAIILRGNMIDIDLLQKRIKNMEDVLKEILYADEIITRVLESHREYANLKYIPYNKNYIEIDNCFKIY